MIYICIPAYNEERTIGIVLWKIRQVMADFERDYEVLVVDDASTDGTGEVMEPYARIMPVHVRRHAARQGYAASLEALIREAVSRSAYPKRDVIVTIQADFTDEPEDVATLVKRIEGGADVVTGRIRKVGSDLPLAVRWSRRMWQTVLRRTGKLDAEGDLLSGFRAYRVVALRRALDETPRLLTTEGWAANAELLRKVAPHSRRTEAVEIEVRHERRQRESRFHPLQTSLELVRLLRARSGRAGAPIPAEAATAVEEEPAGAVGGADRDGRRGRRGRAGSGRSGGTAPSSA